MLAIISDIHSNLEALSAVLADISERDVKEIVCLGDIVGYGPDPRECLDLIMENASMTLMGNHDYAVLFEPTKFNVGAETACFWTRQVLEDEVDVSRRNRRWDYLGQLPVRHTTTNDDLGDGELSFVHGSPRRPINEYVFPEDAFSNPEKIETLFERFERLCFIGHTHVPGVFLESTEFYTPEDLDDVFEVEPRAKALINVGSVGQPRDRDPRASYCLVEPDQVSFVRIAYDVDVVAEKVFGIAELDDYLGNRLKDGR